MFGFFPIIILLVAIIWVYQDGLSLRKKGVPINPGLVAGLIVLAYYLIFWISLVSPVFYRIPGYSWFSYLIQFLIPILVYLVLKFTRYQKLVARGNPPLPPARRWGFWFMLATIFVPVIFIFISFSFFFRRGW